MSSPREPPLTLEQEVSMTEDGPDNGRDGVEAEPEKELGQILDDARISGADAQEESGTVEGQVPGSQSRIEKPGKDQGEPNV
jgi:hypothetical protein